MILNIRALAVFAALSLSAATGCAVNSDAEDVTTDEGTQDLVSRSAYFETFQGLDGKFYFHLMAGNGENVLRSQGYTRAQSATDGIASVQANGLSTKNFVFAQASSGDWYFNLVAGNGEIIGSSQLYATKSNATRGATTVRALLRLGQSSSKAAPHNERFETFKGEDGKSYFRLRAGNGEIMLASQGYTTLEHAQEGIDSVKANGGVAGNYDVFEAGDGTWGVDLVAGNGEIIARTETYSSKSNATRAVARMAQILAGRVAVAAE